MTPIEQEYRRLTLESAGRLLSCLDRRSWSPTFGCFDREYWHYKTLLDFPRATFQQSVLALALFYKTSFEGNFLFRDPVLLDSVKAAVDFWLECRNGDGSVNEWFVNERSFCATAYTLYGISEALLTLDGTLDEDYKAHVVEKLERTGAWVSKNENLWVANQMAVSLLALANIQKLQPGPFFENAYAKRKRSLLKMQSSEGWFTEYTGCDPGYSLLTLETLAILYGKNRDVEIKQSIEKLLEFLNFMIHPDGTFGGDYGSRGTSHCFPFGVELLASLGFTGATSLLPRVRQAILNRKVPTPFTVDDTYFLYFYANSFAQAAALKCVELGPEVKGPLRRRFFSDCGFVVFENPERFTVVNLKKGGCWRSYSLNEVQGDGGYVAQLKNGNHVTSQTQSFFNFRADEKETFHIEMDVDFVKLQTNLPLIKHMAAFKFFTKWFLQVPSFSKFFTRTLKKLKIFGRKPSKLKLHRRLTLSASETSIDDTLSLNGGPSVARLFRELESGVVHSPSSQMFCRFKQAQDVAPFNPDEAARALNAGPLNFKINLGR